MSWLDGALLALVTLSLLLGVWRGFVREALSLAAWVIGVVVAFRFGVQAGAGLPFDFPSPFIAALAGGVLLLLAVLVGMSVASLILRKLLQWARLSAADRMLGALFGLLRAAVVIVAVVLLAERTALARQPLWQESAVLPWVQAAVRSVSAWLPFGTLQVGLAATA